MLKKFNSEKFKVKPVVIACTFLISSSLALFAACTSDEEEEDETTTSSVTDTQLLKNGNFEFFTKNESDDGGFYYIADTDNSSWTSATVGTGSSSYTKSGVIDTSSANWTKFTDVETLGTTLEDNYALLTDDDDENDDDYVDYNGLRSYDLPYVNTYDAIHVDHLNEDKIDVTEDSDSTEVWSQDRIDHAKDVIANPGTHYTVTEKDGKYYLADGTEVFKDSNGYYYKSYDSTKETDSQYSNGIDHVLMVHNFLNTSRIGTAQKYSAATTITLEANTAAKISVWVKTTALTYQGTDENTSVSVTQDRGAFIEVAQSVGGSSVGSTYIKNINTEKLIQEAGDTTIDSNGWLQYSIYVQGCDFASTTLTISLGLGGTGAYLTEGYAFFDDLEVTKYSTSTKMTEATSVDLTSLPVCTLADIVNATDTTYNFVADTTKISVADDPTIANGTGAISSVNNAKDHNFYIDLTSSNSTSGVALSPENFTSLGLTVDTDGYTSSKHNNFNASAFDSSKFIATGKYLYDVKKNDIDTSKDFIALVNASNVAAGLSGSEHATLLQDALKSAANLPSVSADAPVFVMLSVNGAAYSATISNNSFSLAGADSKDNNHAIVSFWIKTSDLNGNTAATITLVDKDNSDNTASFTIDTTTVTTTDIGDDEDIYDGWVQCFFFIENNDKDVRNYELKIQYGNTTLNGTTSFYSGWLAITDLQVLQVTDDEFNYISEDTYAVSFTFEENSLKVTDGYFDEVIANQTTTIESNISNPANYTGVNGGSVWTIGGDSYTSFDDENSSGVNTNNSYAGLINQEYFEAGNYKDQDWFTKLVTAANQASNTNYAEVWSAIFGDTSVNGYTSTQPLLLVNTIREYASKATVDEETFNENKTSYWYKDSATNSFVKVTEDDEYDADKVYYTSYQLGLNYGYIGSTQSVSTSTYEEVAVRVKVSAGAVAYVYLIDTNDTTKTLTFETGKSYWYDEEGNIMRGSEDDYDFTDVNSIAYKLRSDGLYDSTSEAESGKLFANLSIYKKLYNKQNISYYTKDGVAVSYDDLDSSVTYYTDNTATTMVPHYLVADDGTRLYKYENGNYYYIEKSDDTAITTKVVYDFNSITANWAALRYAAPTSYEYKVAVDARYNAQGVLLGEGELGYDADGNYIAGKWVMVNFYLHTEDSEKSYRLELWSGTREDSGVTNSTANATASKEGSYIIFDYAYKGVTESNYSTLAEAQVAKIRAQYLALLTDEQIAELPSADANLNVFEKLFAELKEKGSLTSDQEVALAKIQNSYKATYNSFSLYDSSSYIPFNEDYAESNQSGYDFTYDTTEELAYLSYKNVEEDVISYQVFANYTTVDKTYEITTTDEDEDEDDDDTTTSSDTNIWLLASSIALVAALIFVLISISVRNWLKERRRHKVQAKNVYASSKRKRYIRKLGLDTTESVEEELPTTTSAPEASQSEPSEAPTSEVETTEDKGNETEGNEAETTESNSSEPDDNTPQAN